MLKSQPSEGRGRKTLSLKTKGKESPYIVEPLPSKYKDKALGSVPSRHIHKRLVCFLSKKAGGS